MIRYPRNRSSQEIDYYIQPGFPIQSAKSSMVTKNGYIQRPVTSAPNEFWSHSVSSPANRNYNSADVSLASTQLIYQNNPALWDQAYSRAFGKFTEKVRGVGSASLGTAIAEAGQAYQMVYHRLRQLATAYRHLRRKNVAAALRALKSPPSMAKPVSGKKSVADQWLELNFGWVPVVQDIFDALETLQNIPGVHVKARGATRAAYDQFHSQAWSRVSIRVSVEMRAHVRIESPAVYTLETLGLVNPSAVLWEVIPFSFLVDWFVSVGDFLSNQSAFTGLTLEDASYTYFGVAYDSTSDTTPSLQPARLSKAWLLQRRVGVPPVPPITVNWPQWSARRAANSAALLVQLLSKDK